MTASTGVADVYQSLKAALDILKVEPPESVDVPSKQVLVRAAEQIKNDAAKIGLLCSGGAPPEDQQAGLAASLQRSCVTFVTLCHACTAAAGPSLKESLIKLAQDVIHPCLAMVKDMGSGKDLKSHVGLVWERVASVSKAATDNKACLFAALAKVMAVMKDTLREMDELQEEQQEEYGTPQQPQPTSSNGAANSADAAAVNGSATTHAPASTDAEPSAAAAAAADVAASSTGQQQQQQLNEAASSSKHTSNDKRPAAADDDLDFEADEMSYWERQLLTASIALLQASAAVVKAFGRALLQGPVLASGSESLDGWESCLWHSKHLRRAVEDLGAAMYPPQDLEELGSAALAVFEVTELMADECPDPEAVGAEQLSSLNQQLLAAHEEVARVLKQAQEEEEDEES